MGAGKYLKGAVVHWTAGNKKPNATELEAYHYLFDDVGEIYYGNLDAYDNADCNDNIYARHTGGYNTGRVGISLCGMLNYKSPKDLGPAPITRIAWERACMLVANLARLNNWKINKFNVGKPDEYWEVDKSCLETHWEVGQRVAASAGKIDIVCLPWALDIDTGDKIGNHLRKTAGWYLKNKMI